MSKKAFTMQFHWIFILIAGAIILAFFFSLVQKQRVLSEEKLSITLATDIEAVFSGAIESKGTAQPLPVPKTGIAFSCSEACECNFWIGNKATSFRDKIIFAPDLVTGQDAVAWAQDFKLPFRIVNFLYFTNPNIKYYFVYNPSNSDSLRLYNQINKSIPPGLNLAVLTSVNQVRSVPYEGFQETKFVFLDVAVGENDLAAMDRDFRKEIVSAVAFDYDNKIVSFFDKAAKELDFTKKGSVFLDDTTLFAAVFAADKQLYECGLMAAFARASHVAQVVYERASLIQANITQSRPECSYDLQPLQNIINNVKKLSAGLDVPTVTSLVGAKGDLERENKDIIRLSCPEIY